MSFYNYLTRLDHRAELAMDSVTAGIFSCKIVGFMLHAMKSPSRVRALHFTVFWIRARPLMPLVSSSSRYIHMKTG